MIIIIISKSNYVWWPPLHFAVPVFADIFCKSLALGGMFLNRIYPESVDMTSLKLVRVCQMRGSRFQTSVVVSC